MTTKPPKFYLVYDARAMLCCEDASIMEALGGRFTRADFSHWEDCDAVLVEYDADAQSNLSNERVIGHFADGFAALCDRIDGFAE